MALQGVLLKKYALYLSFFGLLAVGIFKLTEYAIRKYIERHKFLCKKVKISFSQLSFILSIYNNPVMADRDHSATMSCLEAVFFALAMSLDGMFGGLGAGFFRAVVGEKIERESGGGTGKVILVCVRAEYGNSEGEGSGPDQTASGCVGCGKSVGG